MSTVAIPSIVKKDATVISLIGFAHGTSHFFHLMLPPLFPWFMRDYGLSYTQVGALMTVFFIVSVAGLGNAVFHPADFSILNHLVSQPRLGHAFSAHGLSGNLGWVAGPLIMTGTATAIGWRSAGLVAALIGSISLATLIWR